MGRYLLFFSYVGNAYSGLQIQPGLNHAKTVAQVVTNALQSLQPSNEVHLMTASRTDKGVHALCNTAHVDLIHREEGTEYDASFITGAVNIELLKIKEPIRIMKTVRVADDFHCRFKAKSRSYIYRLTVANKPDLGWCLPHSPLEYSRSYLIRDPIDMDLCKQAADLLQGTHDFTAFTNVKYLKMCPWVNPVKTMQIQIGPGLSIMGHHTPFFKEAFKNWEFSFKANSFLNRQVRKMTAVILGVGCGKIPLSLVEEMRDRPQSHVDMVQKAHIYNVPACGLYLQNVEYDPEDLLLNPAADQRDETSNPSDIHVLGPTVSQQLQRDSLDSTTLTANHHNQTVAPGSNTLTTNIRNSISSKEFDSLTSGQLAPGVSEVENISSTMSSKEV